MNVYVSEEDCKSELGKLIHGFRAERPDEWTMDEFIREADKMHDRINELTEALQDIEGIHWGNDGDCGAYRIIDRVLGQ